MAFKDIQGNSKAKKGLLGPLNGHLGPSKGHQGNTGVFQESYRAFQDLQESSRGSSKNFQKPFESQWLSKKSFQSLPEISRPLRLGSKLSSAGTKRGVRSLPMRIIPSRQSTLPNWPTTFMCPVYSNC